MLWRYEVSCFKCKPVGTSSDAMNRHRWRGPLLGIGPLSSGHGAIHNLLSMAVTMLLGKGDDARFSVLRCYMTKTEVNVVTLKQLLVLKTM